MGDLIYIPGRGPSPQNTCKHAKHMPVIPEGVELFKLSSQEVREQYPRYSGRCDDCGTLVILYASPEHYVAGDW